MTAIHPVTARLQSLERRFLAAGALGLALTLAGAAVSRGHFFRAWLMAWLFWTGIGLGCTGILLLHNLTGGAWGGGIRRLLESASRTLPLAALLSVPLLFGLRDLYPWARPEVVAADLVLRQKSGWLNVPFLLGRSAFYLACWILISQLVTRWSLARDRDGSARHERLLKAVSGPGIILYVLTATLAAVDWLMSLDPHWFSTLFGLFIVVGQVLSGFAFVIPAAVLLARREPLARAVPGGVVYDLGNLLLAFVMLWAYLAYSQFLIIWAGNLPEEIPWYLRRLSGGWQYVGLLIILFHFALPFLLLIARPVKRRPGLLAAVAGGVLLLRLVDLFWVVSPAGDVPTALRVHWLDLAAPLGLGGVWLGVFLGQLKGRWDVAPRERSHVRP